MPQIRDMGQNGFYFPSEGRRAEDSLFALEKSDGFGRVWTCRTWVPKASTLPLDHRSRFICTNLQAPSFRMLLAVVSHWLRPLCHFYISLQISFRHIELSIGSAAVNNFAPFTITSSSYGILKWKINNNLRHRNNLYGLSRVLSTFTAKHVTVLLSSLNATLSTHN